MKIWKINKPFGMLSQFSDPEGRQTLKDLPKKFSKDVYPIGRLDSDSEGLLLLTDSRQITNQLLNPLNRHEREYWVQVEGIPNPGDLEIFKTGIQLGDFRCLPAYAERMNEPDGLWDRFPPVRFRKTVPDCWIRVLLTEGKNRQVRRMTAAAGFPTLRLIRYRIKSITIENLQPGESMLLKDKEIRELLT